MGGLTKGLANIIPILLSTAGSRCNITDTKQRDLLTNVSTNQILTNRVCVTTCFVLSLIIAFLFFSFFLSFFLFILLLLFSCFLLFFSRRTGRTWFDIFFSVPFASFFPCFSFSLLSIYLSLSAQRDHDHTEDTQQFFGYTRARFIAFLRNYLRSIKIDLIDARCPIFCLRFFKIQIWSI